MQYSINAIKTKLLNQNNFWNNLFRNVITIFTGNVAASVTNFISTFILLRTLIASDYAKLAIAINYMSMIDLFVNFQSWQGVIRFGSEAIENDAKKLANITKAGLTLDFVTSILGTILGILIIPIAANLFHWDNQIKVFCIIFSLEIFFHLEGTITGLLRLFDKFKYVSLHLVLNSLLKCITFLILFLMKKTDILLFAVTYVILDIIRFISYSIIGTVLIHRKIGFGNVFQAKYSELNKGFWHFTIWANLASGVDAPIKYFDTFFISLSSLELVAAYNVFKKIIYIFNMAITPISQAIMPQLSKLISVGKKKEAYLKMHRLRNIVFLLGIPFCVILGFSSPLLLKVADKKELIQYLWILYYQLPIYLVAYCYLGIHPLFSAYGYSKYDFFITLFANFAYVLVIVLTIKIITIWAILIAITIQLLITLIAKEVIIKKELKQF